MGHYFGRLTSQLLDIADPTVARAVDIAATVCLSLREARIRKEQHEALLLSTLGISSGITGTHTGGASGHRTGVPDNLRDQKIGGLPLQFNEVW